MRCVGTSRITFYALVSLIAVIAVIQVPLPLESLTMPSSDDDASDRAQRIEALHKWFDTTDRDGLITVEDIQLFLDEMTNVHFLPAASADGRAAAIISAGYASRHSVAEITNSALVEMSFLPGNAKTISSYLGSPAGPRKPMMLVDP